MSILMDSVVLSFILGICIFLLSYLWIDKIFAYFSRESVKTKESVMFYLNRMFIDVEPKKVSLGLYLISFGLGAVIFLLFWPNIVIGFLLGSIFVIYGWKIPVIFLKRMWDKRCNIVVDQMVDGLTIMSNGIKSGLSITQSMDRVNENLSGPITQEFLLVLNKVRLGMTVEEALNEFSDNIPRQDVQMFVTAINILKETGGSLSDTFETIVNTIRERQKIQRKIEAMTVQGIAQGVIITLVPFALLIMMYFMDRNYIMPLFTRPLGWFILAIMLGLIVMGGIVIKKIVTIDV